MHTKQITTPLRGALAAAAIAASLTGAVFAATPAYAVDNGAKKVVEFNAVQDGYTGWATKSGEYYWFDAGEMAKYKAIYDAETQEWYWIDDDGTMAYDKDAYVPATTGSTSAKWVRLDSQGHMVKGYDQRYGAEYYFDPITGAMAKGEKCLTLSKTRSGWFNFDTVTGKMDVDKDVYIPSNGGKWCRYDEQGVMIHGEDYRRSTVDGKMHWWYFDSVTGAMAKGFTDVPVSSGSTKTKKVYYDSIYGWMLYGKQTIDGKSYEFDSITGELKSGSTTTTSNSSSASSSSSEKGTASNPKECIGYDGTYNGIKIDTGTISDARKKIIEVALAQIGTPYKYGGRGLNVDGNPSSGISSTPTGFSCDGFTAWVYDMAGVKVYDSMADSSFNGQYAYIKARGKLVTTKSELKPGDIIFFGSSFNDMRHAAIYYGKGTDGKQYMIHSAGHYVNGVRVGVTIAPLDSDFLGGGSSLD